MNENLEFKNIFQDLKSILVGYSDGLTLSKNEVDDFWLNTKYIMKNKKPIFFAAVQIKKNYVTYHLMPVYVFPELLLNISPELRRRMQGKSCFNFKLSDKQLYNELAELTAAGYQRYKQAGYLV